MSESFYDEHIAPELARLAKLAQDNGISLIAMAEWEPGETGRTVTLQAGSGFGIRMAEAAMRSHGNVDSFMIAMMRHGRKHGHSSMFLHQAGVPVKPEVEPAPPKTEEG